MSTPKCEGEIGAVGTPKTKAHLPRDFEQQLNKLLRAAIVNRPKQLKWFIAEYFDAELDRRTLLELQSPVIPIKHEKNTQRHPTSSPKQSKEYDKCVEKSTKHSVKSPTTKQPSTVPKAKIAKRNVTRPKRENVRNSQDVDGHEQTKQTSEDDSDRKFYMDYFLTHETEGSTHVSHQIDDKYEANCVFMYETNDQIPAGRDSDYYVDYFLTCEKDKKAFVPDKRDSQYYMDYFLTDDEDRQTLVTDENDSKYTDDFLTYGDDWKTDGAPPVKRDSKYYMDYFLTNESTFTSSKTTIVLSEQTAIVNDESTKNSRHASRITFAPTEYKDHVETTEGERGRIAVASSAVSSQSANRISPTSKAGKSNSSVGLTQELVSSKSAMVEVQSGEISDHEPQIRKVVSESEVLQRPQEAMTTDELPYEEKREEEEKEAEEEENEEKEKEKEEEKEEENMEEEENEEKEKKEKEEENMEEEENEDEEEKEMEGKEKADSREKLLLVPVENIIDADFAAATENGENVENQVTEEMDLNEAEKEADAREETQPTKDQESGAGGVSTPHSTVTDRDQDYPKNIGSDHKPQLQVEVTKSEALKHPHEALTTETKSTNEEKQEETTISRDEESVEDIVDTGSRTSPGNNESAERQLLDEVEVNGEGKEVETRELLKDKQLGNDVGTPGPSSAGPEQQRQQQKAEEEKPPPTQRDLMTIGSDASFSRLLTSIDDDSTEAMERCERMGVCISDQSFPLMRLHSSEDQLYRRTEQTTQKSDQKRNLEASTAEQEQEQEEEERKNTEETTTDRKQLKETEDPDENKVKQQDDHRTTRE